MIGFIAGAATLGVVVAIATGAAYFELQEVRRQQREWRQWAESRQWQYQPEDRTSYKQWRAAPFGKGHTRTANNIIEGVWDGLPVTFAHYTAVTGAGRSRRQVQRTVAQFRTSAKFPQLEIHRGPTANVTTDIQFESAKFNDAFDVRGPDHRFAFDVVHPRFMAALLDGKLGDAHVSFEDGLITVWCEGHVFRAKALSLIERLAYVVQMVPTHVWRDLGAEVPRVTKTGATPVADQPAA